MMKSSYIGAQCGKSSASSQSLWNHKQRCKGTAQITSFQSSRKEKDKAPSTVKPIVLETYQARPPINPKIQTLLNDIVDDGIVHSPPSLGNFEKTHVPALKKIKLASFEDDKTPPPLIRETLVEIEKPLSPPPSLSSVIAKIFPPIAPPAVPKSSRTREWLVDYSDDDDDEEESHDESIDIHDLPPPPDNVKFLPTTIEGLRASFEELIKNIAEDRKSGEHEKTGNRNEAVFLLDELKREGGISRRMYRQYNNLLAESLPVCFGIVDEAVDDVEEMDTSNKDEDEEEEEEEEELSSEDDLKKEIGSTIDYLIEHDKKELLESVKELQRDEERYRRCY